MPPLAVRRAGLSVSALVVADHHPNVLGVRRPAPAPQQRRAAEVQGPAHLFPRHLGVFPPAARRCAAPRTPSRSPPASGAASARRTAGPRSASAPLPLWPVGSRARSSPAGTPPP